MNPHPIAKVFAPVVFLALALLSLGFSFGPAGAHEPTDLSQTPDAAPYENVRQTRINS